MNILRWEYAERFDLLWPAIHPRYRRIVTRKFWLMCKHRQMDELHAKVRVLGVKATGSHADEVVYPLLGRIRVETVTIQFRYHYLGRNYSVPTTVALTKVRGEWRTLWTVREYRAYSRKRCFP